MSKTYLLKIASAVVVNGTPVRAGDTVDVSESLARRLLASGKAELASGDEAIPPDENEDVQSSGDGTDSDITASTVGSPAVKGNRPGSTKKDEPK